MKYRKKPVVIEAVKFTGKNYEEVQKFASGSLSLNNGNVLSIKTLEGEMLVSKGDYVIKGINGEIYPCKPDIFEKTYEEVVE